MSLCRSGAKMLRILLLLLGLVWLVPQVSGQYDPEAEQFELEYAGSAMWGWIQDVAIYGDFAFCAMVNGLQILNMSNPTQPGLEGRVFLGEAAVSLAIAGDRLYLGCRSGHLYVFDISDPTRPTRLMDFDYSHGSIYDPAIWQIVPLGDTVFMACNSGLVVLDLSDLSDPAVISEFAANSEFPKTYSLAVVDDTVYLGSYPFTVVDVSDLEHPREIGRFDVWGEVVDIEVSGDLVYLADRSPSQPSIESRLLILEMLDGNTISQACSYSLPGYLNGFYIIGSLAYCITEYSGTVVLDISNPTAPDLLTCLFPPLGEAACIDINTNTTLAVVGNHGPLSYTDDWQLDLCESGGTGETGSILTSAQPGDMAILDISSPGSPEMIGTLSNPGLVNSVTLSGARALVCSETGGMSIVDVSPPSGMAVESRLETSYGSDTKVAVVDSFAFVAGGSEGIQIVNVSGRGAPEIVSSFGAGVWASGIDAQEDLACVANYPSGISLFDVSDHAAPTLLSELSTPGSACDVLLYGDYALVADLGAGLQIVDISDPSKPSIAGNLPGYVSRICTDGQRLFTVSSTLRIYSLATAPNLSLLGEFSELHASVYDLAACRDLLCLAHAQDGISIIDVSDPCHPIQVATHDSPGIAVGISIDSAYVYVADYSGLIAMTLPTLTSVEEPEDRGEHFPTDFRLKQNYPNPFNPRTAIAFELAHSGETKLTVFNVLGQRIRTLVDEWRPSGSYTVRWHGNDENGNSTASGVYLYRLTLDGQSETKKMIILK